MKQDLARNSENLNQQVDHDIKQNNEEIAKLMKKMTKDPPTGS